MLDLSKSINLFQGDCLEVMKGIPDGSVDLVLTDPPYGTTACKWDTVIDLELMWKELKRIIKPSGAIVMTAMQPFTTTLIASAYDMFKYTWVWEKNRCGNYMAAKYKPLKYSEDVVVFGFGAVNTKGGKGGGKTSRPFLEYNPQNVSPPTDEVKINKNIPTDGVNRYNKLSNREFKSKGSNYPKDIIKFSLPNVKERLHPTQKPVPLLEYLIKTYTNESETVLDFTMGSGSTGVACKNLNRKFIGIELDETYFNIAKERVEDV